MDASIRGSPWRADGSSAYASVIDGINNIFADFLANVQYFPGVFQRMGGAILCGALIGWERERQAKPAGLRTNTLIALGACMYMMIGTLVSKAGVPGSDPGRIGAQVVSGVGFLGAGTILRGRATVHGLTSAATIWVAAAVGLYCGSGFVVEAFLFTLALLGVLVGLRRMEGFAVGNCAHRIVEVAAEADAEHGQSLVSGLFEANVSALRSTIWVSDGGLKILRAPICAKHLNHRTFLDEVSRMPGVRSVRWAGGGLPSFLPSDAESSKLQGPPVLRQDPRPEVEPKSRDPER